MFSKRVNNEKSTLPVEISITDCKLTISTNWNDDNDDLRSLKFNKSNAIFKIIDQYHTDNKFHFEGIHSYVAGTDKLVLDSMYKTSFGHTGRMSADAFHIHVLKMIMLIRDNKLISDNALFSALEKITELRNLKKPVVLAQINS